MLAELQGAARGHISKPFHSVPLVAFCRQATLMRPSLAPSSAATVLHRLILLPDGSAQANFSDRSLVVLNPCAASFVLVSSDGKQVRGLTRCVTTAALSRVARALHVRNVLCTDAPRVDWELVHTSPAPCHYFDTVAPMDTVSWPTEAVPLHALRHKDGAVRILSLDRRAWLLLHPQRHTFMVCFPVCAGAVDELPDGATTPLPGASELQNTWEF